MFVKKLSLPLEIQKTEILHKWLPEQHPKKPEVEKDLVRMMRGYKGEKAMTYYLDFLPNKDFYIFHNLRLPSGKYYFQLDYLILTRHYITILECKNFYGTLIFDEAFKQLIRVANNQEEGFQDPISQAKWHKKQLQAWLEMHGFPPIPIDYLVVISDPSTIIKAVTNSPETRRHVVHSQIFLERMEELVKGFRSEVLDDKILRKLSKQLLKSHPPNDVNLLRKYGLKEFELLTGVQCPLCGKLPMKRVHGSWVCPSCHKRDKNAHLIALHDYFLLIDSSITNKKFRDFAGISSIDTASRLLTSTELPFSGEKKNRIYHKPQNIDFLKDFTSKTW